MSESFSEREGFQVGKTAALAEWRHRQDKKQFTALVNRLRVRKWQMEHLDQKRAKGRAWAAAHLAEQRDYQRARGRARARQRGEVYTCKACGASWCPVPWARGLNGRGEFCTSRCYQRYRYAHDVEYREKQKRRQRARTRASNGGRIDE